MADYDIIALGEALIEFNQTEPGRDQYLQGYGGDTSNAVIAAARAGARCAYLSRVGDDAFGAQLLALWRREGVDVAGVAVDADAHTGVYFVQHGPQGHVFNYLRRGSAASRMTAAGLERGMIGRARFLHVSGISLAISGSACDAVFAALEHARQTGVQTSLDSNLRLRLWPLARARAILREAMAAVDLFLPSMDDMRHLTGHEDADATLDWIRAAGAAGVVVLKLGREARCWTTAANAGACRAVPCRRSTPRGRGIASRAICWRAASWETAGRMPWPMPTRPRPCPPWAMARSTPCRIPKPCSPAWRVDNRDGMAGRVWPPWPFRARIPG